MLSPTQPLALDVPGRSRLVCLQSYSLGLRWAAAAQQGLLHKELCQLLPSWLLILLLLLVLLLLLSLFV